MINPDQSFSAGLRKCSPQHGQNQSAGCAAYLPAPKITSASCLKRRNKMRSPLLHTRGTASAADPSVSSTASPSIFAAAIDRAIPECRRCAPCCSDDKSGSRSARDRSDSAFGISTYIVRTSSWLTTMMEKKSSWAFRHIFSQVSCNVLSPPSPIAMCFNSTARETEEMMDAGRHERSTCRSTKRRRSTNVALSHVPVRPPCAS